MRKVIIPNSTLTDDTYKSTLSTAYTSGTTLTLLSNVYFSANDLIVVGEIGESLTELKKVSALGGNSTDLTLASALNFSHPQDTPVYKVAWDNVSIEKNQAVLSLSAIQWDKKDTIYYDQSGTATDSYRFRYYNSVTGLYSEYSGSVTGSGYPRASLGFMIREIRKLVQDERREIVTDDEITRFLNEAQDIVNGVRQDWWWLRVEDTSITGVAATKTYALPSGLGANGNIDTIRVNYINGNINQIYHLKFLPFIEFDDIVRNNINNNTIQFDFTQFYTKLPPDSNSASGYIQVWPIPKNTGIVTFMIRYFKPIADLSAISDTTPIPYPNIIENYAISQIERIKGNEQKATMYMNLFLGPSGDQRTKQPLTGIALLEQLNQAQKRPIGQPRSIARYEGQTAFSKMFGDRFQDRDFLHENYWGDINGR